MKKLFFSMLLVCSQAFGQTFPVNNLQVNGTAAFTGIATFTIPIAVSSGGTGAGTASGTALDNITGFSSTGFLTRTGAGAYAFQVAPTCSSSSNALQWTGAAFACNSAIVASSATTASTAATQSLGNNTTNIATTAFVSNRGPCANIMDFGGNNTASANNDTAFANAKLAASNLGNQICVYFPPGNYNFASTAGAVYSASHQAVTIVGAGQDVTVLQWAANGGLTFTYKDCTDSTHISDMTIAAGTTNSGVGILLNNSYATTQSCAMSTISRVTIRGSDNYFATNYFSFAIEIIGVSDVNIDSVQAAGPGTAAGTGLIIGTGSSSIIPIIYNISNSGFFNWNTGLQINAYTQGVQVTNSNFTNNNNGLLVPSGQPGLDQISVSNSQFNSLTNGFNIYIQSAVPNVAISNNVFLINNTSSGVNMQATSTTSITGNLFEPNTGSPTNVFGVILNGHSVGASMVSGNNFYNLTAGVTLQSTSASVNVQSNAYNSCTTNTSNAGTGNVIGGGSP